MSSPTHFQQPFSAPNLVLSYAVDMAYDLAGPLFCLILVLIPFLVRHFYLDYKTFLSLGPGGTPQTIPGYLKLKLLAIFALRDPYQPPPLPLCLVTRTGYFSSASGIPVRPGPRPQTAGIAPHRQMNEQSSEAVYAHLTESIKEVTIKCPELQLGTSCFEKNSTGLFCTNPQRRTCGGEICHSHPSDGSMHLTLHPTDARILLESGWGERHPLARGGWLERFVPGGFVLVYAPRTVEEIAVVMEIVRAAAWWVAGKEVEEMKTSSMLGMSLCGNVQNGSCADGVVVLEAT